MEVIDYLKISDVRTSVALGCFDGLHIGHKKVISDAVNTANFSDISSAVFTFDNPLKEKNSSKKSYKLMTDKEKIKKLETWGVEKLYKIDFSDVMDLQPEVFVEKILKDLLHAEDVYCGFNYKFGKHACADSSDLVNLCLKNKIKVHVINPVKLSGRVVSSSFIRECIENGKIEYANDMLGYNFGFELKVVEGRKFGKSIGVPTINQMFPEGFILPKLGVYASYTYVDGVRYLSVTDIGVSPTMRGDFIKSETWILDYGGKNLYGNDIKVELMSFLRNEKIFNSVFDLKQAILRDAQVARKILE